MKNISTGIFRGFAFLLLATLASSPPDPEVPTWLMRSLVGMLFLSAIIGWWE